MTVTRGSVSNQVSRGKMPNKKDKYPKTGYKKGGMAKKYRKGGSVGKKKGKRKKK